MKLGSSMICKTEHTFELLPGPMVLLPRDNFRDSHFYS
jgi:hypothetical protein